MKINILLGTLIFSSCAFVSCNDEATLDSSKTVYITIAPKDSYVMVGDTVQLSAEVSNEKGDILDTPVEWTVNCENIAKKDDTGKVITDEAGHAIMIPAMQIIEGNKLIANNGAQGKTAQVKAALTNGKYGLSTMTATNHVSNGVGAELDVRYSYSTENDTVWFIVDPVQLLLDYTPEFQNSDPEVAIPHSNPVTIKPSEGRVGYSFSSGKKPATSTITMTIAGKTASCDVVICPAILSTFESNRKDMTYEFTKTMDINSTDTVWVYTAVNPNYDEDMENATKYYTWQAEGNSALMVKQGAVPVTYAGHNAFVELRSGAFEGTTTIKYSCYGTDLTATIYVQDYNTRYPVDEIQLDKTSLSVALGSQVSIAATVVPLSSYSFHQPKFVSNNTSIAEIMGYSGSEMFIKGVGVGETTITITSNDKTVVVPIEVTDAVQNISWVNTMPNAMFVGTDVEWEAKAKLSSGAAGKLTGWTSSNTTVATVVPKGESSSIGVITANAVGTTSIQAVSGAVKSDVKEMKVIALPTNLNYTSDNTNMDGNAIFKSTVSGNKVIEIDMQPTATYGNVSIFIFNYGTSVLGTFNASTSPMTVAIDGAEATVESGTITIAKGSASDVYSAVADLIVKVGTHSFTLKTNIEGYK